MSFRKRFRLTAIAAVLGGQLLTAAHAAASPDDAFLHALEGNWTMNGMFRGKAVQYHAQGERVLQGGFVRLHMIDAAATPMYEADVYLGFDPHHRDYIMHWLDRFGAAGARVVGTGMRNNTVLTLIIPYEGNEFRDTLEWQEKSGTWSLLIESRNKDGTWSEFAHYTLVRA